MLKWQAGKCIDKCMMLDERVGGRDGMMAGGDKEINEAAVKMRGSGNKNLAMRIMRKLEDKYNNEIRKQEKKKEITIENCKGDARYFKSANN